MTDSIQHMQLRALQAITSAQFNEAIDLYSRLITLAQETFNDHDMSLLFAERAGCYIFWKKYEESLMDSETAISLDTNNVLGYVQKSKALFHLNNVKEAREVVRVGRILAGANELFDDMEKTINNSWFILGHKRVKCIVSLLLGIVFGVITNMLGGLSGWKQAIIAMFLRLMILFLRLHRLYWFLIQKGYVLQHNAHLFLNYIWRLLPFGGARDNDTSAQPITIRF